MNFCYHPGFSSCWSQTESRESLEGPPELMRSSDSYLWLISPSHVKGVWLMFQAWQNGEIVPRYEETQRRGRWSLRDWRMRLAWTHRLRDDSGTGGSNGSSTQSWLGRSVNLGVREWQSAGQEPRQAGFGEACLLTGVQLGDEHRKEFLWISLRSRRTTDTPESYSCSPGSPGFKTILFFFLCLFGLVQGVGERRKGGVQGECGLFVCSWSLGSQWTSGACHLSSLLLHSLL